MDFCERFANDFEIVDPTDEKMQPETISINNLRLKLQQGDGIIGEKLQIPLPPAAMFKLAKAIDDEFKECSLVAQEYIARAKEDGQDF